MKEIKLYKAPLKSLRLFLLSAVFVGPSLYFIITGDNSRIWWLCLCFFGIGTVISMFNMFDRRALIIFNKEGILDTSSDQGLIPWEMIKEADVALLYSRKFICLDMDERFVVKKKLYKWAQIMNDLAGARMINLNISLITVDDDKLETFIDIMRHEPMETRDLILERYEDRIT
jgi:hypothetical protein